MTKEQDNQGRIQVAGGAAPPPPLEFSESYVYVDR